MNYNLLIPYKEYYFFTANTIYCASFIRLKDNILQLRDGQFYYFNNPPHGFSDLYLKINEVTGFATV